MSDYPQATKAHAILTQELMRLEREISNIKTRYPAYRQSPRMKGQIASLEGQIHEVNRRRRIVDVGVRRKSGASDISIDEIPSKQVIQFDLNRKARKQGRLRPAGPKPKRRASRSSLLTQESINRYHR